MLMNKKVAIICDYKLFPERIGGMDRFFVAFDKVLKTNNYNAVWVFKDVVYNEFYDGLKIYNASNASIESFFLSLCRSNNFKFDIVITHFLTPVSSFYKNIKNLMNSYVINVDHNPRPLNGFPLIKRIKNRIKGLLYGKYVNKLIGVSNYTSNYILKDFGFHLKNKTVTIYNGVEIRFYKTQDLNRLETPFNFIVVSHLRESKGIQDLLKALSLLKDKNTITVDIYGDGPYYKNLRQLQKDFKLESIVTFKGSTPRINELLANYHYLIQPTYMECFSLSILESLASNVPVITTTVGGNLEVINDEVNGYVFQPKEAKALSLIIKKILSKEISISKEVNSKIRKHYTLEIMVKNHLNLLKCI
jgi:L-malate glycosyltransferase